MMNTARNGFPFTTSQWQELEHQVHIFKQMVSGIPIPSDLLYTGFDSSVSSELLLHQPPHHIGWSCSQMGMGYGRKIDPEPGRCRRTDGKKWRCSKEAYLDSKYCERHMHRGKNRSRKPVEFVTTPPSLTSSRNTSPSPSSTPTSQSFSSHTQNHSLQHPYLHYNSYESPKTHFSSQDNTTTATNFMLESDPYSISGGASMHDTWQLAPLAMGSLGSNLKQGSYSDVRNDTPLHLMERRDDQSKKVMHHFFDQQKERNLWHDNNDDNLSSNAASSNIQLSISIPTSSHDFFLTRTNEK